MNAGVMMRLVRDRSLIFADLGDLRVLIASSALLSDRAGEGLATVAFAVGLGAAFTGKDVRDSAGCGSTPGKMGSYSRGYCHIPGTDQWSGYDYPTACYHID